MKSHKLRVLEIGCGCNPYVGKKGEDVIHLDAEKFPHVEIVWNLNKFPWPFKESSFDIIIAKHVIEHLEDIPKTLEEVARILKVGGVFKIWVPHFSSPGAFFDVTHKHFFAYHSFDAWDIKFINDIDKINRSLYTVKKTFLFGKLGRLINLNTFARIFPDIYESFISRVIPAYQIYYELKLIRKYYKTI